MTKNTIAGTRSKARASSVALREHYCMAHDRLIFYFADTKGSPCWDCVRELAETP